MARTESRLLRYVGLIAFVVAVVGFVVFGWEFGGESDPVATGLALVAVVIAVVWTLANRR